QEITMSSVDLAHDDETAIFTNPRPALLVGVLSAFAAYVASWLLGHAAVTALLLVLASFATGVAVAIAPKIWWVLASAAVVALLCMLTAEQSLHREWHELVATVAEQWPAPQGQSYDVAAGQPSHLMAKIKEY